MTAKETVNSSKHLHKILYPAPVNYRNMDSLPHSLTIPEEDRNFKAWALPPIFYIDLGCNDQQITIIRKFFTNSLARNIRSTEQKRSSTITPKSKWPLDNQ